MSTMTINAPMARRAPVRPTAGSVRLTRRGRLVVLLAALGLVLAVGFALASGSVATEAPGTPAPTQVVMVGAGDTLWDIAADLAADGDVRSMMEEIEQLNALESGMLVEGQKLRIPTD